MNPLRPSPGKSGRILVPIFALLPVFLPPPAAAQQAPASPSAFSFAVYAITHQALATWAPSRTRPGSLFSRFRAVPSPSFANTIVVLYPLSALLGAIVYLYFRVDVRPDMERAGQWSTLGLFDIKEHFVAIGMALLPAYWLCWRKARVGESARARIALTSMLAVIVWWSFLVGHAVNNIRGFGS